MGSGGSKDAAKTCQMNKNTFVDVIDAIVETHQMVVYYSGVFVCEKPPKSLAEYRSWSQEVESTLNTYKISEFFDTPLGFENVGVFAGYLRNIEEVYTKSTNTDADRQRILQTIFDSLNATLKALTKYQIGMC